jgi:hypothetical protein
MISKLTYGEKMWEEIGPELSRWNLEALELVSEAFFGVWPVDFFHFREYHTNLSSH